MIDLVTRSIAGTPEGASSRAAVAAKLGVLEQPLHRSLILAPDFPANSWISGMQCMRGQCPLCLVDVFWGGVPVPPFATGPLAELSEPAVRSSFVPCLYEPAASNSRKFPGQTRGQHLNTDPV